MQLNLKKGVITAFGSSNNFVYINLQTAVLIVNPVILNKLKSFVFDVICFF